MATQNKSTDSSIRTSTRADGNKKYDVEMYTYPSDLFNTGANQYGRSWVMININVQKNTSRSKEYSYVDLDAAERRRFNDVSNRNQTAQEAAATAGVAGASAGAIQEVISGGGIKTLESLLNKKTTASTVTNLATGVVRGGVAGVAASIPIAVAGTASRETKRIKTAIQLPMPNNLATNYTANWGEVDTKFFDMIMRAGPAAAETITAAFTGKPIPPSGADLAASVALVTQSALGGGGVSAATGLAANPKKEVIFDNMGFRTFTLEYKFFPRSEQEAEKIRNIVQTLKYHMHPEYLSKDRFTYVYPSEFDITFFNSDGAENLWINKIATSVLTNININYTPEGTWAAHNGGSPVAMQVQMTFKELSILTKENIAAGF